MRCPYCQHTDTKVTDSRTTDEGNSIRRRRECINCGRRFTTYEIIEEVPLMVLKKNGRFPNTHVDSSPALRKKGIACARTQDWQASHRKNLADLMGEMMSN